MYSAATYVPTTLLGKIVEKDRITRILRGRLTRPLSSHIWFAVAREGHVILVTDNNCWVSLLRFNQQSILEALSQECGITATRVTVKVSPELRNLLDYGKIRPDS